MITKNGVKRQAKCFRRKLTFIDHCIDIAGDIKRIIGILTVQIIYTLVPRLCRPGRIQQYIIKIIIAVAHIHS